MMSLNQIATHDFSQLKEIVLAQLYEDHKTLVELNSQENTKLIVKELLNILNKFIVHEKIDIKHYEDLGHSFHQMHITFPTVIEIVDIVQNSIVAHYDIIHDLALIVEIYQTAINNIAKGYFKSSFHHYVLMLKQRNAQRTPKILRDIFCEHITWLKYLHENIANDDYGQETKTFSKKCNFIQKLDLFINEHTNFVNEYKQIVTIHNQFHKDIFVLKYALDNSNYLRAYEIANEIALLSIEMESIMSIINILEIDEKTKYDALTGALSRQLIIPILEKELDIANMANKDMSIAMLDIDDFKLVNDTYGHQCGDAVLKFIVQECQSLLRSTDYIFRYGGEEFIILLNAIEFTNSVEIYEKIRQTIANTKITCKDHTISVTVSIGIESIKSNKNIDLEATIEQADINLYTAKNCGKNMIVYNQAQHI